MSFITIDAETRSTCDLKKHGGFVYAADPTTDVLCWGVKEQGLLPRIWKRGDDPQWLFDLIAQAETITAHNMQFDAAIWKYVCEERYGWPSLPEDKLRCSAAQASMCALPRSLENAGAALGLLEQKDKTGYRIVMKLCRPRKPKKDEPEGVYWNEDEADLELLYKYCLQDVVAEEALSLALPMLPQKEQRIFALDRMINSRGIQADIPSARKMIEMVAEHEGKLLKRLGVLTFGAVKSVKQVENMRSHLRGLGCDLPDLTAKTVMAALKEEWSDEVREILEIRRSLGRSSSAKYQAIIDRASYDGRVRGSLLYHGAGTGRWAGSGIQPQNFPSRIKVSDDPEVMLNVVVAGGLELHNALYDDDPMSTAGAVVRSVLVAKEGYELIVSDFSAIEGRGLAWLAGEETELSNYRADLDVYITNAAAILHKRYEDVTKEERNKIGKTSVLSCGYGGSVGAVRKFGGEDLTDDEIKEQIVMPWRAAHPKTTAFWYGLEKACMDAVKEPGKIFTERSISFRVQDKFLKARLPSGRLLYYYEPDTYEETWCNTADGQYLRKSDPKLLKLVVIREQIKESVTYMTVDGMTKKWLRTNTFGGKLAENVTSAICRDLMAEAMLRLEAAGYPVVLSVHDEIVCEVPEGFGSVEEFERIMCEVPRWAEGFPIKAAGWRERRYRK